MTLNRLFDQSLYQYQKLEPSYWEASVAGKRQECGALLSNDTDCDVAIIGGGYTGLSAAYTLAKDHNIDARVVEAGEIGWGASGRNGGFCCMGGTQYSPRALIKKFGLEEAKRFTQAQAAAVELVSGIASDEGIEVDAQGNCEWVVAEKPSHFAAMSEECELLNTKLEIASEMVSREEFSEIGYDAPHQHGAMAHKPGFGLNPLKYCLGLGRAAVRAGANLHPHSEVIAWHKEGSRHHLRTKNGGVLRAKHIIIACNGFMPEHLHSGIAGYALPLQSQIIVTRPLSDDEMAAHKWTTKSPAINSRNVYFYYRMLPDKRFLIGGRGDFKGTPEGAEKSAEALRQAMIDLWPEWRTVTIDYAWRGFVCFTSALRPAIGRLKNDPSVSYGFGYHGNGVNNATWIGKEIADWLATGNDMNAITPDHLPAVVRGMPGSFPFPSFRPLYAKAGVAWHRMLDVLDR